MGIQRCRCFFAGVRTWEAWTALRPSTRQLWFLAVAAPVPRNLHRRGVVMGSEQLHCTFPRPHSPRSGANAACSATKGRAPLVAYFTSEAAANEGSYCFRRASRRRDGKFATSYRVRHSVEERHSRRRLWVVL